MSKLLDKIKKLKQGDTFNVSGDKVEFIAVWRDKEVIFEDQGNLKRAPIVQVQIEPKVLGEYGYFLAIDTPTEGGFSMDDIIIMKTDENHEWDNSILTRVTLKDGKILEY